MMTFRKVAEYLEAEPFQPFRIKMASGATFEIRHPEMLLLGKTTANVYSAQPGSAESRLRWHDVSLLLMETLEPIESSASESVKGTQ